MPRLPRALRWNCHDELFCFVQNRRFSGLQGDCREKDKDNGRQETQCLLCIGLANGAVYKNMATYNTAKKAKTTDIRVRKMESVSQREPMSGYKMPTTRYIYGNWFRANRHTGAMLLNTAPASRSADRNQGLEQGGRKL